LQSGSRETIQQMTITPEIKEELVQNGFTTISGIYTTDEIEAILSAIDRVEKTNETFRKSADLFAVRQFLKEVPETVPLIFNERLKKLVFELFG